MDEKRAEFSSASIDSLCCSNLLALMDVPKVVIVRVRGMGSCGLMKCTGWQGDEFLIKVALHILTTFSLCNVDRTTGGGALETRWIQGEM